MVCQRSGRAWPPRENAVLFSVWLLRSVPNWNEVRRGIAYLRETPLDGLAVPRDDKTSKDRPAVQDSSQHPLSAKFHIYQ